ncbi:DNA-binding protein [Elizabethkingia anophelis]|uniref:DNA-binding protein n=1 Tax=Elizabethkingia anophelis TaxID=1117645 RepID=UPI000994D564|nr:DNA-binding protein [Elizabethkingia anophelis]MCL1691993.1 DNA-binding protein [Elizabethkingia anophelis]MDV3509067.1 DNA-binding protein [Elizabethkingia anophelis]MDV3543936.1 DNA-binding protein [Elizabethkingia anophelis]MDV3954207.1 DNA-binding protein [Elizabethkingia anophelis]MDV4010707.1 DNA-binding protein [Elizabethkingia anophelis]
MKTHSKSEAKKLAKACSYNRDYVGMSVYIIYCNGTENYYVDTNSLIRLWKKLIGYYINGDFTREK